MVLGSLLISNVFSTPVVLAASSTLSKNIDASNIIFQTLYDNFMPYVWTCAKALLYFGCIQGFYYIMRADKRQATDKIKYATMGYIMIKFVDVFVRMVDSIAAGMSGV